MTYFRTGVVSVLVSTLEPPSLVKSQIMRYQELKVCPNSAVGISRPLHTAVLPNREYSVAKWNMHEEVLQY